MRDYPQYLAESYARPAFSTGSAWQMFEHVVCLGEKRKGNRCHHHAPGCPLIAVAITGKTPRQWNSMHCDERETYKQRAARTKREKVKAIEDSHHGALFDVTALRSKPIERDKF